MDASKLDYRASLNTQSNHLLLLCDITELHKPVRITELATGGCRLRLTGVG